LLSLAAALLILSGGYVHLCLYLSGYRFIPKIGVSFLVQSISSAILAGALLLGGGRIRVGRTIVALAQLTRLSAIGLSVGTLAALGIAHTSGGLFQFHELGLRPAPQTLIAIFAESLPRRKRTSVTSSAQHGKRTGARVLHSRGHYRPSRAYRPGRLSIARPPGRPWPGG
jgi:hypothetical protein